MLAKRIAGMPETPGWVFESKWDGFRAVIFRDGDNIEIQPRRKVPESLLPRGCRNLLEQLPPRCVLDGKIVIAGPRGWSSMRCNSASIPQPRA